MQTKKPLLGPINKLKYYIGLFGSKSLLGIDINSNSIRLVELSCFRSSYYVEVCLNLPLCEQKTDDVIVNVLKKISEQKLIKTKNVAIALSYSHVVFKEIKIDSGLTDNEIESFLSFNINEYIGEFTGDVSFDYYIVGMSKEMNYVILRLVIVKCKYLEECTKPITVANFYPKIVDVNVYALERIVRYQLKTISGLIAIINIDNCAILIVVIDSEKIIYTKEDFVNYEELQSVAKIIDHLKLKVQQIFSILSRSLDKIVLAGEKAGFLGLSEAVNVVFNIQVNIINPFLNMKLSSSISLQSLQQIAPGMAICCGLALRIPSNG